MHGYWNNQRHFAFICKHSLKTDIYLILSSSLIISPRSQSSLVVNNCSEDGNPPSACLCWATADWKSQENWNKSPWRLAILFCDKEQQISLCCVANMRPGSWVAVALGNPLQTHWAPLPWARPTGKAVETTRRNSSGNFQIWEPRELLLHCQSCNLMFRLNSLHCALGRQCGLEVTEEGWEPQVSSWDSIQNELLTAWLEGSNLIWFLYALVNLDIKLDRKQNKAKISSYCS